MSKFFMSILLGGSDKWKQQQHQHQKNNLAKKNDHHRFRIAIVVILIKDQTCFDCRGLTRFRNYFDHALPFQ